MLAVAVDGRDGPSGFPVGNGLELARGPSLSAFSTAITLLLAVDVEGSSRVLLSCMGVCMGAGGVLFLRGTAAAVADATAEANGDARDTCLNRAACSTADVSTGAGCLG